MTEQTISGPSDIREFGKELLDFISGDNQATLDYTFEDATVEALGTVWRINGVVRGAYRVMPIGGPDLTRHMALGADLALHINDGHGVLARATLQSGAGHLRLDVDRPEVLLGALPLGRDVAAVVRALADAGTSVEIYGPPSRLAVLDPKRHHRIAGLLTGEPTVRLTSGAVSAWLRHASSRSGPAVLATAVLASVVIARLRRQR